MDVHRARNSDSGYTGPLPALKLAVGRTNGNVEIWNPRRGLWVQEAVFPGNNTNIDGLAWTQDPDEKDADGQYIPGQQRLFSIASSPSVTEWDLATGKPKRQSTGNFSEVWCLAAQPRWRPQKDSSEEPQGQDLVAGCGDGTIALLSTADNDLQFKRFLARVAGKKARCMCITYQNRDRVVAGFADSMIRVYDTRNSNMLRAMSLGVSVPGAPKTGLVWQVRCLPNGDIVSGDSNGEVKFWDGKTYSMTQRIACHDSDCLDLVASSHGRTVMSGSINGKIAVLRQSNNDGRASWGKVGHKRTHSGEVKAMAAFDSKTLSMIVSGGSDAIPMVTPLREYGKENVRALPMLPQHPPVASAPRARLLVSWWEKSITIWRVSKHETADKLLHSPSPRKLVARINLNTTANIRSVSVSADGSVLAAATSAEVKLFQLRRRADSDTLAVRKLHLPNELAKSGAHVLRISENGKWLAAVSPQSEVFLARIASDPDRPKYLQVLPKIVELDRRHRTHTRSVLTDFDRTITQLAFAADGSVLVASDRAGHLDSWVLEGHEDTSAPAIDLAEKDSDKRSSDAGSDAHSSSDSSEDDDLTPIFYGQHWTGNPSGHLLPRLDSPALILTFRPPREDQSSNHLANGNPGVHSTRSNPHAHSHELPHGQHKLFVMTAKHQMFEFDVLAGRLSDWSRRNPTAALPEDFTKIRDRVMGAVWDVNERRERIWLYGSSFVCMLNVSEDLPEEGRAQAVVKKRRKPKRGIKEEPNDEAEDENARKRRKIDSGAGSRISNAQEQVVTRFEDGKVVKLRGADIKAEEDDEDDVVDYRPKLEDLPREDVKPDMKDIPSAGEEEEKVNGVVERKKKEKKWWCTFKYRPILGMVALQGDSNDANEPLEVVIVERPLENSEQGKA
ncbi:U3 small nucleolar RNA-associated protein [Saxophila tyrrhenica]|uniref:U3 small nucleolar RNA-associated protein n=1 Tax=Saxophila tyrrhenica TaxID=1690608 RepID=A0AAV9PGR2_9PEZI|nr:U3 small nucleolar RNA-associated protein [Saxophila tyrrhenica]